MASTDSLQWQFVAFDALSTQQLYSLLQLRTEVFVVEQNCVFQDMDGADSEAMHLLGIQENQLVAYARCFNAGIKFKEASIGRVITRSSMRGTGAGHALMRQAIQSLEQAWGGQPIRIGAQARLEKFYQQHGFAVASAPYIEDGIPHIEMLRS
ncbi:GNAT family N-acetyltransferase [Variovorax sp. PCZ-1]|uniref:GNAT family N-acetyltransferase n=1 Tax=Variovorax sp. PCZ-1 TaxID=2835533 RepID=UPI001BCB2968|nr:GNAT family N-acetyltransferase [Variovorax sp. PCZ-1]MBS7807566.1 GNAT family N-acetyltransferase [Variovorax sp. PCZ-1]